MNDDDLHQYVILHGYDSNSFSTRVTSLQIRADELSGEAAAEDPEAEDAEDPEAEDEVEVTEPVTSQP
jgi:hypothetical protein